MLCSAYYEVNFAENQLFAKRT